MPKYTAAPGTPFNDDDAAEIGPELARLAESGASTPAEIVAYAHENDTPLRRHLHMDRPLEVVADAWYRRRARLAAGSIMVRVRVEDGYREVRAFHSIQIRTAPGPEEDGSEGESSGELETEPSRYVTIHQVRESRDMSKQVIEDALKQLQRWRARYELYREVLCVHHPEIDDVFHAIDRVA